MQQVSANLWNAKHKNKVQANKDNVAMQTVIKVSRTGKDLRDTASIAVFKAIRRLADCHKNKVTEKSENNNKLTKSGNKKGTTKVRHCVRCKQRGHIA